MVKKWRTAGLQVREGMRFNAQAGKAAVRRVEQLELFEKVHVLAASDCDCGDREGIALHVVVKESPRQSADVNTEWSFLSNDAGRPNLVHVLLVSCFPVPAQSKREQLSWKIKHPSKILFWFGGVVAEHTAARC
jgi:hypothetical protein